MRRLLYFSKPSTRTTCHRADSGYALVMALFLIVAMIVSSQVILRNLVTLRRRDRESETIWRGQQYERAIRLYYHKTGKYPQSLDDLQKGLPELHFLRFCAYKDPVNTTDGSWRFIYVNGNGDIIGSVRFATLQQMALIDLNGGKLPGPQPGQPGTPASDLASSSGSDDANATPSSTTPQATQQGNTTGPQSSQSPSSSSAFGTPGPTAGATPGAPFGAAGGSSIGTGPNGANGAPGGAQAPNPLLLLKPTGPVDGPVLGAFITGVASKVDRPSIRVYKSGKKYIDWEFIWNPVEEQAQAVQNGLSQAQGSQQQQQPGQFGLPIGPVNGGAAPGQPSGGPDASPQAQPPAPNRD